MTRAWCLFVGLNKDERDAHYRWSYEASQIVLGNKIWTGATKTNLFPPLLLFQPGAMLHSSTRSEAKLMVKASLFLVQAMEQQHRTIVWPQTDCSSSWVNKDKTARHGVSDLKVYAHGPSHDDRQCFDIGYMNAECAARGVISHPLIQSCDDPIICPAMFQTACMTVQPHTFQGCTGQISSSTLL
jgi:hypothetical protein